MTLAAGEHVRLPRTYRGRDIFWWLQATGLLAERYDQIDDLTRARHLPSPQLTGTPQATITDLNTLAAQGVRIAGRLGRVTGGVAQFSGALANTCALADLKMNRFLNRADQWATTAAPRRRAAATTPVRTHPSRSTHPPGTGPHQRGDHHGAVGDRLPAGPLLAQRPRA